MKKVIITVSSLFLVVALNSCYINTHVVGEGAKGSEVIKSKSWYILGNRISEADTKTMAGGAANYSVDTRHNFVDYLINSVTFGLVGSRTVTVKK